MCQPTWETAVAGKYYSEHAATDGQSEAEGRKDATFDLSGAENARLAAGASANRTAFLLTCQFLVPRLCPPRFQKTEIRATENVTRVKNECRSCAQNEINKPLSGFSLLQRPPTQVELFPNTNETRGHLKQRILFLSIPFTYSCRWYYSLPVPETR